VKLEDVLVWMTVAATLTSAHGAARRAGSGVLASLIALELVLAAGTAFILWSERAWVRLAQEDGIVEWATVFAFSFAAGLSFVDARNARGRGLLAVSARASIGAFCLFVAGEELSWGQRLFALQPPELFLARNAQQELNLHNLLMNEGTLGVRVELSLGVAATALAFGILFPLACNARRLATLRDAAPSLALAPVFLAVLAIEMSYRVELIGEGAELLLGLGFLAAHAQREEPRRALMWLVLPLLLGTAAATTLARSRSAGDDARVTQTHAELALLATDARGGQGALLDKRRLVHKRMFEAVGDGYLDVERGAFLEGHTSPAHDDVSPRRDRRGYFLDPWNNPYWLMWSWERKELVLYSFGPNRQRDTDFKVQRAGAGDDIVVVVPRVRPPPSP
jgi:hypothetical protein